MTTPANTADMSRILLVEDDPEIARISQAYLSAAGYLVRHVTTGEDALLLLESQTMQLVLLDVGLPDMTGFDVAKRVRASERNANIPIIMLTALDSEQDKVKGLNVGADDYVTKPFSPNELVARVGAMLRRAHTRKPGVRTLNWGDRLQLDAVTRRVTLDEMDVQLAPKEFDLLWALIEADGAVLTRDTLLQEVWHYNWHGDTRTIDVHVRQLRKKLDDACPIDTVWGSGYRMRPAPVSS
jgi:DNA-binding response OmpR family regulator